MTVSDAVVIGGGIMGCATALRLAEGGMRVVLIEQQSVGAAASGVNAGTLSIQIKRVSLVPYALRGWELWKTTAERHGVDVGFHVRGGLTLAFDDREAEMLVTRMSERKAAGAPIEVISPVRAREIEPGLGPHLALASFCPLDGYANSSVTGAAYRTILRRAGVEVREGEGVTAIHSDRDGYGVETPTRVTNGRRVVLATGAWLGQTAGLLGLTWPVNYRINQVSVTERCPPVVHAMIGHATGLLTLKQSDNGTVLIGGGWQGVGSPSSGRSEVVLDNVIGNLRLAQYAVPALARTRLVRTWHGFEAHMPDYMPMVGAIPDRTNAFVIGCVRGGYTIGPYMGRLLGDLVLGRSPEMPLFDPGRFLAATADAKVDASPSPGYGPAMLS
jgi:glycine/D-amino acid oxidase-like deaminating enzyme